MPMDRPGPRRRRPVLLPGLAILLALGLHAGCSLVRRGPEAEVVEQGVASWYGPGFHGRTTANGERYDMHGMTAAHRTLPFGTLLEVRNLDNGRTCRLRVNDRGPFVRGRILDVSYAAAQELGMVGPGTARVEIAVLPDLPPRRRGLVLASAPAAAEAPAPPAEPVAYTVQVGAFGERERAETLRALLARHFDDARVRSDGAWHRVQVGAFGDRAAAERLREELEGLGWTGLVVEAR